MKRILYPLICPALLLLAFFMEGRTPHSVPSQTNYLAFEQPEMGVDSIELPPNFDDVDKPAFDCEIEYPSPDYINASLGSGGFPIGACDSLEVQYTDEVEEICQGSYNIIRKWIIEDKCSGEILNHNQFIHVKDTTPPEVKCADPSDVWVGEIIPKPKGCEIQVLIPNELSLDNCSGISNDYYSTSFQNGSYQKQLYSASKGYYEFWVSYGYTNTFEHFVMDDCGNYSTCSFDFAPMLTIPPIVNCIDTLTISEFDSITTIQAQLLDNGSSSICYEIHFNARKGTLDQSGDFVEHPCNEPGEFDFSSTLSFDCCDISTEVPLYAQLRVRDYFNNESFCVVPVVVIDLTAPHIICPPDFTVDCAESIIPTRQDTLVFCAQPDLEISSAAIYSVPIEVGGIAPGGILEDLDLYLHIDHALLNELRISLISPGGKIATPINVNSCAGQPVAYPWNLNVTLNDQAFNNYIYISTGTYVPAPYTCTSQKPSVGVFNQGHMQPQGDQLAFFNGDALNPFRKTTPCVTIDAEHIDPLLNQMNGQAVQNLIEDMKLMPGDRMLLKYKGFQGTKIASLKIESLLLFEVIDDQTIELLTLTGADIGNVVAGSQHTFCATNDWLVLVEDTKPLAGGLIHEVCLHIAYNFPKDIQPIAFDNVGNCNFEVSWEDEGTPSICPEEMPLNRHWTATDASGNSSSCIQQIFFENPVPFTVQFPCPMTVNCEDAGDTEIAGDVIHSQACGEIDTRFTDDTLSTMEACFIIHRNWEVRNLCIYQNDGSTDYTIFSIDNADGLLTFDSSITPLISSRRIEPGDRLTLQYYAADPTPLEGMTVGDIYSLIYVGNTTFRVDYNSSAQAGVILGGVADGNHLFRYANSSFGLPRSCDILPTLCPVTPWQTTCCDPQDIMAWEDDGDGYFRYVQVLTVENIPTWSLCQDTVYCIYGDECETGDIVLTGPAFFSCSEAHDIAYSYEIDMFNNGSADITGSNQDASGTYPVGTHRITFTAMEPCGKSYECSRLFTIQDCQKPTATCLPFLEVSFNSGNLNLSAQAINAGNSTDNCTAFKDLTYKVEPLHQLISGQDSPGIDATDSYQLTCDDLPMGYVPLVDVVLWAGDLAGNWGQCTTRLLITNAATYCKGGRIKVNLYNPSDEVLQTNVEVNLSETLNTVKIASMGMVIFDFLEFGKPYTVTPSYDILPLNGVTTYDLLLMQSHMLGKKKIDNPYFLIAGDINKDCKISISDIIELRKMILTPGLDFSNNKSWRFVDANYVFPDHEKPCIFPEETKFPFLSQPFHFANFVGIKIGDLSGDANLQGDAETRQASGELFFTTSDHQFEAGEELKVIIRASDFVGIQGYQYTLDFDPEVLELVALSPVWSALDANHFGDSGARQGQILTSWFDVDGVTLPDGEALYTLRFRTKAAGSLSRHLRISDRSLRAEAYASDETLFDVKLRFDEQASNESAFQLYPNQPNPVGETTTIGFRLPEACRATLSIYTVTGQLVYQVSGHYPGGYSAIAINRADLPQDGVLFYELQTPTHRATKRMVVAE